MKTNTSDISVELKACGEDPDIEFVPILRSGAWADIGFRSSMEDAYVCADNIMHNYGMKNCDSGPSAFYGVSLSLSVSQNFVIIVLWLYIWLCMDENLFLVCLFGCALFKDLFLKSRINIYLHVQCFLLGQDIDILKFYLALSYK